MPPSLGLADSWEWARKDVAIPFEQLQVKDKNGDRYLVMEANKEALNSAPGLKFDRTSRKWVPENQRG